MPSCLLILIGLPGSGKTSLARKLQLALSRQYRVVHVEYDAVVDLSEQARLQAAAAAGEGDEGWRNARRELERAVEEVITSGDIPEFINGANMKDNGSDGVTEESTEAERPTVFIIDDNMYLRSMRYRYFQLARRHQLGYAVVLLDVPVTECLRRNAARDRPVPDAAIEVMAEKLERPDPARLWESRSVVLAGAVTSEGASVDQEIKRVTERLGRVEGKLETVEESRLPAGTKRSEESSNSPLGKDSVSISPPSNDPVSIVSELVSHALASPVAPLVDNSLEVEASRLICSTSQLHQLDRQLRRLVGEHAAGCGVRARAANLARQKLMRRVRAGEVGLAVEPGEDGRFAKAARVLFEAELAAGTE
ncbi:L-seryl-tRNA(Sec) kinase-like isoform X1 [Amphibalanus amphitrite]|uniref:L-seryl-tRNA(Sec) kinase-like isoform X1 n=1 Tax=Amphibalanus amphitrite TaxID=1232801 RepID=UPI001C925387|nr:L-seryl-tRNA(Sec) kinase-like isoform X1 [Amphibalanus amphitrite]XP_043224117.1 L-seryl-tRNA(Sec) kinase-like isoform X1 [Amphibalanus amphitrite]XP_043224118.1 L-seryl-tRNA(Sec) kinase-like isoform X1 [Amphibalanus amphitrite]